MPIIKEQIKYLGVDMNLKFNLDSHDDLLGYQQEIDNLTQGVSAELINPGLDLEQRRYKYLPNALQTKIQFKFTTNGTSYVNSFINAGFTQAEIDSNSYNMRNSFFIFEFYNTYDVNTQTKLLTNYITKIGKTPTYTINSSNQIYCQYVPMSYITTNFDAGITGVTGYTKISFYNAKSGALTLFNNVEFAGLSTPLRMFFPTKLDFVYKSWNFLTSTFPNVYAIQSWTNQQYINKVNNTFTNFNNEAQNYPSGSEFDYNDGKYI